MLSLKIFRSPFLFNGTSNVLTKQVVQPQQQQINNFQNNSNNILQVPQCRYMSKYLTKSATKRLILTTKRAKKGYYKGKGSTKQGHFRGKAGTFVLDQDLMMELVVPDLKGFTLKPYIANTVPKWAPEDRR